MIAKTPKRRLQETGANRRSRARISPPIESKAWKDIDPSTMYFDYHEHQEKVFAKSIFDEKTRLVDIFNHIFPEELLKTVWESHPDEAWYRGKDGMLWSGNMRFDGLIAYLAVYTRITALQNVPKESNDTGKKLRMALSEAREHFANKFPTCFLPGVGAMELLMARFNFKKEHMDMISKGYQSAFSHFGSMLAGDEKLLKFTGNSSAIRLCPAKPDRIGLWFYELCCKLSTGRPVLLYMRIHQTDE